jgi:hypothetical protein
VSQLDTGQNAKKQNVMVSEVPKAGRNRELQEIDVF